MYTRAEQFDDLLHAHAARPLDEDIHVLMQVSLQRLDQDCLRIGNGTAAEATDGLSDEQYVRNLVDALFRPRVAVDSVTVS